MDGMSGKHTHTKISRWSIIMHIFVSVYAFFSVWPNFSISHFNPIQSMLFLNTLSTPFKNSFKCEYIRYNWNSIHCIHNQSIHSLTHSFVHSYWAPSFMFLVQEIVENICRNAYWNQMLRTVENTVIQRYSSSFLVVVVHMRRPVYVVCVCIRMRTMVCLLYVYNT